MKLKLSQVRDIPVLTVIEDLKEEHVPVLRAGLKNLFRTGKSKIVLDLSGVTAISEKSVIEMAAFHDLAQELAGRLVLVATAPGITQVISKGPHSSLLPVSKTVDEAVSILKPAAVLEGEEDVEEQRRLETAIQLIENEISRLQESNKSLEGQLANSKRDEIFKFRSQKSIQEYRGRVLRRRLDQSWPPQPKALAKATGLDAGVLKKYQELEKNMVEEFRAKAEGK